MHQFEGTVSRHVLPPFFLVGKKQWIHAGDSVEIVGLPRDFWYGRALWAFL